jgi:hypothetical protein
VLGVMIGDVWWMESSVDEPLVESGWCSNGYVSSDALCCDGGFELWQACDGPIALRDPVRSLYLWACALAGPVDEHTALVFSVAVVAVFVSLCIGTPC